MKSDLNSVTSITYLHVHVHFTSNDHFGGLGSHCTLGPLNGLGGQIGLRFIICSLRYLFCHFFKAPICHFLQLLLLVKGYNYHLLTGVALPH